MNEKIEIGKEGTESIVLKSKAMDLNSGYLGRCFGSKANAQMNIAGTVVLLLVASAIATLFFETKISALDYWRTIVPLITLVMGFVFGKGSN